MMPLRARVQRLPSDVRLITPLVDPRFPRLVSAAIVLSLFAACGTQEADNASDRYAHRYVPYQKEWRLESQIPPIPQETPGMVIWEVSDYPPETPPTEAQNEAADALIKACFEAAERNGWFDVAEGNASGYFKPKFDPNHFRNDAFFMDGVILDPEQPENLMYFPQRDGTMKLVGFMFMADSRTAHGPQVGGNRTVWHYHVWKHPQCIVHDILPTGWADEDDGSCEKGVATHRSGEMMHVWLIDHPQGPFATSMSLDPRVIQRLVERREKERGF